MPQPKPLEREALEAAIKSNFPKWIDSNNLVSSLADFVAEREFKVVESAFDELRATPKDSWYGTMPEILERIKELEGRGDA